MLRLCCLVLCLPLFSAVATAETIQNPSFENGWEGWLEVDKDEKSAKISSKAHSGESSAELSSAKGTFAQSVAVEPNASYRLSAHILGTGIIAVKVGNELYFERQAKTKDWKKVSVDFVSAGSTSVTIFAQFNGRRSTFDDFELEILGVGEKVAVAASKMKLSDMGLSGDLSPGKNFKLTAWALKLPEDLDGDGRGDNVYESDLVGDYQHEKYFYTAKDGGMVFRAPIAGDKTPANETYKRSQLREMLRRGNKLIKLKGKKGKPNLNNWVLSSAPKRAQESAGAVDGVLKATLAVNHVTTTGKSSQVGRVVIAELRGNKDAPISLYYRKIPGHDKGSVYVMHKVSRKVSNEALRGKKRWYTLLGSPSEDIEDPENGIALDEVFSYEIAAKGNEVLVSVSQKDVVLGSVTIDISESGYDVIDDYMYFNVGAYNENKTGEPDDYVQATFYALETTH